MSQAMVIGIDASRSKSGGARAHLIGLISRARPMDWGISTVHLWAYSTVLDEIPNFSWLIKHSPKELEGNIITQLFWQAFRLPYLARSKGCQLLFNTDAGTVCRFSPSITLSQDMLSYEPGEMSRYRWSMAWLRLMVLRWVQNSSLRNSTGAIFLTQYASTNIQKYCGPLRLFRIIPHGVGEEFRRVHLGSPSFLSSANPIRILYVSNTAWYKHQWMVVQAVDLLRQEGFNIVLELVGGGSGASQRKLLKQVEASEQKKGGFVKLTSFVPQEQLPEFYAASDIFIFASSCENMPITLMEAMASGIPIACSNRGPMPEVLSPGGVFFDPEDVLSISNALRTLIVDDTRRNEVAICSRALSENFSWERTAQATWDFIASTASDSIYKKSDSR